MNKFILICFAVMAIGFYELSGGSDFDPEETRQAALDARVARSAKEQDAVSTVPEAKASQVTEVAISENPAEDEPVTASARPEPAPEPVNLDLASFDEVSQKPKRNQTATETQPSLTVPQETPQTEFSLSDIAVATETRQSIVFSGQTNSSTPTEVAAPTADFRTVKGTLVNMRSGPGTEYEVVDQLSQNTEVEILTNTGNGWAEVRALESGSRGWIAEFLLNNS